MIDQRSIDEWNSRVQLAIDECADCMRRGNPIDWEKYKFVQRPSKIWKRARALLRAEQEAAVLFAPAFQMNRGASYQYLLFLCLLLGLIVGRPFVAIREDKRTVLVAGKA